jgi:hypothetical protein
MRKLWILLLALGMWRMAWAAPAKPADQDDVRDRLGERFTSRGRGISFRPPMGGAEAKRTAIGTDIVRYSDADEKWALNVSMMTFEKPTKLVAKDDPATPQDETKTNPGILQQIVRGFSRTIRARNVLRQDVVNVGQYDAGMIVVRYMLGASTMLRQQAIIQRNDQLFYVLDFVSPSGHTPNDKPDVEDPAERMAVEIFGAVLDSVQLLDQKPLLADEEERLYRTRTLLVNLPKRIRETLSPEEYFRVIQNGKDIGWTYVIEEPGERLGENGFFVASLSEATPAKDTTVKVASEMFCSLDLSKAKEAWVTINYIEKAATKSTASEFGQSEKKMEKVLDERNGDVPANDPKAPRLRPTLRYHLNVTQTSKTAATPINRDLPPFYIPQAIGAMLPRLVPYTEPKGYLFLVWVGSERELIKRYIDVEPARTETFNGSTDRMIVVKDRIGLEGEPVLHYFSASGKYLGNFNKSSGVSVVGSDQQTMARLWPNATFARPQVLDKPGGN